MAGTASAGHRIPWLQPGEAFPDVTSAWTQDDPAPGLLAAGGELSVEMLARAYRRGIFPWFSPGQPILWWAPDPRMALDVHGFRLHRSLRKTLQRFVAEPSCEIRIDHDFRATVEACAASRRTGQSGTWIVESMVDAYTRLHQAGMAHSVETWIDGELAGGLYCVALGQGIFGESMFTRRTDASKIALAALVALCGAQGARRIDCQQNTRHLGSLGAREITREAFLSQLTEDAEKPALDWHFNPVYWTQLLHDPANA